MFPKIFTKKVKSYVFSELGIIDLWINVFDRALIEGLGGEILHIVIINNALGFGVDFYFELWRCIYTLQRIIFTRSCHLAHNHPWTSSNIPLTFHLLLRLSVREAISSVSRKRWITIPHTRIYLWSYFGFGYSLIFHLTSSISLSYWTISICWRTMKWWLLITLGIKSFGEVALSIWGSWDHHIYWTWASLSKCTTFALSLMVIRGSTKCWQREARAHAFVCHGSICSAHIWPRNEQLLFTSIENITHVI